MLGDLAAGRRGHHARAGADIDAADVVAACAHDVQDCTNRKKQESEVMSDKMSRRPAATAKAPVLIFTLPMLPPPVLKMTRTADKGNMRYKLLFG